MWPFAEKELPDRLAAASEPGASGDSRGTEVSVLMTIVSPSAAVSPFTGMRAAIIYLELLSRVPNEPKDHLSGIQLDPTAYDQFVLLGSMVIGDLVTLRDPDGDEITIVTRRARIVPALPRRTGRPIERVPAEVVPLLAKSRGGEVVCYNELMLSEGDQLKLTAWVEPSRSVVNAGYRSATRVTYVARDDRDELVLLEEIFEAPDF